MSSALEGRYESLLKAENLLHSIEAQAQACRMGLGNTSWKSVRREMVRWNNERMRDLLKALDACIEELPECDQRNPPPIIGPALSSGDSNGGER